MDNLIPNKVFLTKGVGRHKYQLKSFEQALQKAGVAQQNLVQILFTNRWFMQRPPPFCI